MTIKAHFDGKAIIPDEPVELNAGEQLVVHVDRVGESQPRGMTGEELAASEFVGAWKDRTDIGDTLEFARELRRRAERRDHGE